MQSRRYAQQKDPHEMPSPDKDKKPIFVLLLHEDPVDSVRLETSFNKDWRLAPVTVAVNLQRRAFSNEHQVTEKCNCCYWR